MDEDPVVGPSPPWPVDIERWKAPNRRQRVFSAWMTDILVYVVVLNLYVEYSPAKVIDSFTISILMAVLLKVLLSLITAGKSSVWRWARSKGSSAYTIVGALGVWAILFLSKFLILEAEDLIFGDHVELGGFVDVMLLAATLLAIREVIQRIYVRLGRSPTRR
jgi:hypothetical protein